MPRTWVGRLNTILWGSLLLALPITSFPLLLRFLGGSTVAPLSVVPLILLTFTLILPTALRQKSLPNEVLPLMLFFGVAILATLAALYKDIPSFRETSVLKNALEGILTLITGMAFFLAPIYMVKSDKDLRESLRLIYIAGGLIFLVCTLQASTWFISGEYPVFLHKIQNLISSSGKYFIRRVYGLALEPSWLANQLNIIFIPMFTAASFHGFSLFKVRLFKRFSVENILLLISVVALFLSFSRIGWLTSLLLLAFLVFRWVNIFIDRTNKTELPVLRWKRVLIWSGLVILFAALMIGLGFLLTKIDPRNAKLFDIEKLRLFGFLGWASQLGIAERVVYWVAAYQVYLLHPILGIGLGGAGYFFPQVLLDFGFRLPEILKTLTVDTSIPNAKNLWVRLLSETGIIGFICFVSWLYLIFKSAIKLEQRSEPVVNRFIGMFGKLALLALLIEAFSTDTFGLPYFWLVFGFVIAVARFTNSRV